MADTATPAYGDGLLLSLPSELAPHPKNPKELAVKATSVNVDGIANCFLLIKFPLLERCETQPAIGLVTFRRCHTPLRHSAGISPDFPGLGRELDYSVSNWVRLVDELPGQFLPLGYTLRLALGE